MTRPEEARQALQEANHLVRNAPTGIRSHTLMQVATAMWEHINAGDIPQWVVENVLKYAGMDVGLDVREITSTLASAARPYTGDE